MKVRDSTAQPAPGLLATVVSFSGPLSAAIVSVLDSSFGAQTNAEFRDCLVVQPDLVAVNVVLDPDAFLTLFAGANHLSCKVAQ